MNRLTGLLMKLAAAPWLFQCPGQADVGAEHTAALNSQQGGQGAHQIQLWLLPILQMVSVGTYPP